MPLHSLRQFTFIIEVLPVPKARPRVVTHGPGGVALRHPHTYTPAGTAKAEGQIREHVLDRLAATFMDVENSSPGIHAASQLLPLRGALGLQVTVYVLPPKSIPKRLWGRAYPAVRPDLDNYVKTVADGIAGTGLWVDDSQICTEISAKRYAWDHRARWEVAIWELSSEGSAIGPMAEIERIMSSQ